MFKDNFYVYFKKRKYTSSWLQERPKVTWKNGREENQKKLTDNESRPPGRGWSKVIGQGRQGTVQYELKK